MNPWKLYKEYAADNPHGYWFKRKLYGWGWTPVKWQGWAVIGVFLVLILLLASTIKDSYTLEDMMTKYFIPLFALIAGLIWICYRKGEKPKWQWGKHKED